MGERIFLTLAEIIEIHRNQIDLYGGSHGVRDFPLLQSAIAQPQASFFSEWLHKDIYEMAAAYAFHICNNHPFIDGNKRTALSASLVFLELNGIEITDPKQKLLKAMFEIAEGKLTKLAFAQALKSLS